MLTVRLIDCLGQIVCLDTQADFAEILTGFGCGPKLTSPVP
jgi:hypothetical protein